MPKIHQDMCAARPLFFSRMASFGHMPIPESAACGHSSDPMPGTRFANGAGALGAAAKVLYGIIRAAGTGIVACSQSAGGGPTPRPKLGRNPQHHES